ncbi:hypothetical protein KKC88_06000 [Patescibacteria group bacterium]|nr:hypothetical protein [Patescibacteria group bacterium]MBU1673674.1 hypothetical protein [Patescibacteria group bacterium]MBU1963838.1 hypothetical protein [Patescibacteria group bacterium]
MGEQKSESIAEKNPPQEAWELIHAVRKSETRIWSLMSEVGAAMVNDRTEEVDKHLQTMLDEYQSIDGLLKKIEANKLIPPGELASLQEHYFISILSLEKLIKDIDRKNFHRSDRPAPSWLRDFGIEIDRSIYRAGARPSAHQIRETIMRGNREMVTENKLLAPVACYSVRAELAGIPENEVGKFDFELTAADNPDPFINYNGYDRLFHIYMGWAARKASEDYPDVDDVETDLHSANIALENITETWEQRYPPVAGYYQYLRDNSGLIFEMAKKYYEVKKLESAR